MAVAVKKKQTYGVITCSKGVLGFDSKNEVYKKLLLLNVWNKMRCMCDTKSLTLTQSKPRKAAFSQLFPAAVTFAKIPQTIFKAAGGRGRHFVLCRD